MLVLKEALIGCALTDATLRQGLLGGREEASDSLAEQAVLNAVVALLEADAMRQAQTLVVPCKFMIASSGLNLSQGSFSSQSVDTSLFWLFDVHTRPLFIVNSK